jgi:hypothetical protein
MTLVTEPSGAKCYYNGAEVGVSPVTFHFGYYQPAELRFEMDGYETRRVVQPVTPPVYERFPLDFFAETLWPFRLVDEQRFVFELERTVDPEPGELLERAAELRGALGSE